MVYLKDFPRVEVVKAIISTGIYVNQENIKGETVLYLALRASYVYGGYEAWTEIIKELIAMGAVAKVEGYFL
jgi:hypothetical protein